MYMGAIGFIALDMPDCMPPIMYCGCCCDGCRCCCK